MQVVVWLSLLLEHSTEKHFYCDYTSHVFSMLILTATNASEEIAILQTLGLGADILKDCLVVIGFEAR